MAIGLCRGPRNEYELRCILTNQTAGGKACSLNPTKPSDSEMEKYEKLKGSDGECFPPRAYDPIETEFTEYTSSLKKAMEFGNRLGGQTYTGEDYRDQVRKGEVFTNGVVVCIVIDEKYVTAFENDSLEKGYLIRSDTPFIDCRLVKY